MISFIHEEHSWNKQEQILEFVQVGKSGLFNCPQQCRGRIFALGRISSIRKKLGLHKGQVFNFKDHCQASCPSSRTDHMVNDAINIIHWLTLSKRLRLPPGNITRQIHRALKS